MKNKSIVLFDGICNLCEASVVFIIKRDRRGRFGFLSIQSAAGERLMNSAGVKKDDADTVVLLDGGAAYTQSTAVLKIAKGLDGMWPVLYIFIIIPRPIRDALYAWIARNRYRWFGKKEVCMIPDSSMSDRFI